jgi:hypothetical protein
LLDTVKQMAPRNAPSASEWAKRVYGELEKRRKGHNMSMQQQLQFVVDFKE